MECRAPSSPPQRELQVLGHGAHVIGHGHVEFEHVGWNRQVAGHPAGQRQATAGTGQDDLGPLLLGQLGDGVRQRVVGEHPCYQNALSIEQSGHGRYHTSQRA